MIKPIFYYHVGTSNRGDMAIKKAIVEAIEENLEVSFSYFNIKTDELTEGRIINQLNSEGSALIIAGSGLYTNYPKSSGWYFPCKTRLFKKIKIPIILLGIGNNLNLKGDFLNTELTLEAKNSIKMINDQSVISTVRDRRTWNLLNSIGVKNHELMLDPGNFLKVKKVPKEKKVAIQIAQHAPILGRFDGGEEGQKNRTRHIKLFAHMSQYLQSKGYEVVFITHDSLEHSLVNDLLKYNNQIKYLNTDNLDTMLEEYASCEFTIAMKMHSAIMSFAAGTPAINLYYDIKSANYLKMINCEWLGRNIFGCTKRETTDLINQLIYNLKGINKKIIEIKRLRQIKYDQLIKRVCNIIKNDIP